MLGKSIVITSKGDVTETKLEKSPSLEVLQQTVGGLIQLVPLFNNYHGIDGITAYCNDEGKLQRLPLNVRATEEWWQSQRTEGLTPIPDFLVGTVIILYGDEEFKETL